MTDSLELLNDLSSSAASTDSGQDTYGNAPDQSSGRSPDHVAKQPSDPADGTSAPGTTRPATQLPPSGYRNLGPAIPVVDRPLSRHRFRHLNVEYDPERSVLWSFMNPADRPCFTIGLLTEVRSAQAAVRQAVADSGDAMTPIRYVVVGSQLPGIFNMGGHLELFASLVETRDRAALESYARLCIDCVYAHATHLDMPITTISLVQGDALGGGFEQALSSDIIIAEKRAKFGLPEIMFGLFPGMGAYTFLARRLGAAAAEKMIKSGKIYTADDLLQMGLVDQVVEDGFGREAVNEFVTRNHARYHAHQGIYRTRNLVNPISYQELADVTDVWVDTAMHLTETDIRKMRRLAAAQTRRQVRPGAEVAH